MISRFTRIVLMDEGTRIEKYIGQLTEAELSQLALVCSVELQERVAN